MKRLFFFFTFLSVFLSVKAQYVDVSQSVITASNAFAVGDTATFIYVFGGDNFSPGDSGQFVIWDFSSRVEIPDSMEHYQYIDPGSLPDVPPSTTVAEAVQELPDNYFYYNTGANNDAWQRTGFYSYSQSDDFSLWIDYSDDITLLSYPFTYGATGNVTNYEGPGGYDLSGTQDSANVDDGNYTYTADAWGVLITPFKTYKNVIRVHSQESFQLHLYLWGTPFSNSTISDDSYFWYSPDYKGYVMKYIHSTSDVDGNTSETYYLAWRKIYPQVLEPDFTLSVNDTNVYTFIDTVKLINLSSPISGTDFTWEISPATYEFVNNTNANSVNPEVVFKAPGYYTVTLNASNGKLNDSSFTRVNIVHATEAPKLIANFEANPTIIDVNGIVEFTNLTNYTDGTTWLWQVSPGSQGNHWDFVDFTSDTDFEPHIQFYQAGCYSIRLVATNDTYYNSPDDTIRYNYINVGGGCGNTYSANFTVIDLSSGNPVQGATVTVSGVASATTDENGEAAIDLYNGSYNYTISAEGYADTTGSFTVSDADVYMQVELRPLQTSVANLPNVKVYPVPAKDFIFISSQVNSDVFISDMNGKTLIHKQVSNRAVDISSLPQGVYLLKIVNEKGVKVVKIVKR